MSALRTHLRNAPDSALHNAIKQRRGADVACILICFILSLRVAHAESATSTRPPPQLRRQFFASTNSDSSQKVINEAASIQSQHAARLLAEIALRSEDAQLRKQALFSLRNQHTPSAMIANFINLQSSNPAIRNQATANISQASTQDLTLYAQLMTHPELTDVAYEALINTQSPPYDMLIRALSQENITSAAKHTISEFLRYRGKAPQALRDYYYYLLAQQDWHLLSMANQPTVDVLRSGLKSDSPTTRGGAARMLGSLQTDQAITDLIALLTDPDNDVRRAAKDALIMMKRRPHKKLTTALFDPRNLLIREDIASILNATEYRAHDPAERLLINSLSAPANSTGDETEINAILSSLVDDDFVHMHVFSNLVYKLQLSNHYGTVSTSTRFIAQSSETNITPPEPNRLIGTLETGSYYEAAEAAQQLPPETVENLPIHASWLYAIAMQQSGSISELSSRTIPFLLEFADYGNSKQAARAAHALYNMGLDNIEPENSQTESILLVDLNSTDPNVVRQTLLRALREDRIPTGVNYQAVLRQLGRSDFPDDNKNIARLSALLLSRSTTAKQLPALLKLTESTNETEQYHAALALSMIRLPENSETLVALLFSRYPELVYNAIQSLSITPDDSMSLPLMNIAVAAPQPLRSLALTTLYQNAPLVADMACTVFSSPGMTRKHRRVAALLLIEADSEQAINCLLAGMKNSSPQLLSTIVAALSETTHSSIVTALFDLTNHASENVRISAQSSLLTASPTAIYPIIDKLDAHSAKERHAAHHFLCLMSGKDFSFEKRDWNDWRLDQLRKTPSE